MIGELELKVILDIVRGVTPSPPPTEPTVPPTYGPFTGTTDGEGRFEVPIPPFPNTSVPGKLTECTLKPLSNQQVSVTLVPKPGVTAITRVAKSRGCGFLPQATVRWQQLSCAFFRPWICGLTECGKIPLSNQEFTLTLMPKGEATANAEDIAGFTFRVPGYQETTVTQFSRLSIFGFTWYNVGTASLFFIGCPEIPLRVLTQNTKRLTHNDPWIPAREQEIFKLLRSPIEYNFDIVCL